MEHTGRYYEPVARFLHEEGVFVSAVNPKLIKDYGNNTLRKVKTDKADARKIARYGLDNWAELRQHTPMDTIRMQLKTLNRQQSLYAVSYTHLDVYKRQVLAEEAIKKAVKDYYDKNGIPYDHSLFPDCEHCAHCSR